MALTPIEKWQLLAWLLYQQGIRELSASECLAFHHLLMAKVGENYQQIACEPPKQTLIEILFQIRPGQLEVCDAVDGNVLHSMTEGEYDSTLPPFMLLQSKIQSCHISSLEYIIGLYEKFLGELTLLSPILPQPLLADNAGAGARSGGRGRKWKKFRRDPMLFFKDFLGKWFA